MMIWLVALVPLGLGSLLSLGGTRSRAGLASAASATMILTAALAAFAAACGWQSWYDAGPSLRLIADLGSLSGPVALLVPCVALPVVVYAASHEREEGLARLVGLLVVFVGAMELLVMAADFLTLLVAWELVGACSWALIGHAWRDIDGPRSATRAFLVTRLGDLGLFVAAAALFGGTGSFAYEGLRSLDAGTLAIVTGGVIVAAASKSAQLPFAAWLFSAMAGPTSVSALLHAATMVAAGAFILARLHGELSVVPWFGPLVLGIGLVTALAGGLVAVFQSHAKKLLAASTSAHYGLMWVAIGAGYPAVAILHLIAHAFFKALLFLAAGVAGSARGTFQLTKLRVGSSLRWVAAASGVGALALAGVPPLGAAWSKEQVLSAAGHEAGWVAVAVALAGGLSAAYSVRFQLQVFDPNGNDIEEKPGWSSRAAVLALAAVTLAFSFVWLPGLDERIADVLAGALPPSHSWEFWTSIGCVALGLYAGRSIVQRQASVGREGLGAGVADWLGLPVLGVSLVERPVLRLAHALARFDDSIFGALPRAAASFGRCTAEVLSRGDAFVFDALPRRVASLGRSTAAVLSRGDDRVVDAGVRATSRIALVAARIAAWIGEAGFDGVPEGLSRLFDSAGRDVRRTQTGFSHHYYAIVTVSLVVLLAALIAGG